jgi:hypothetical protein
MKGKKYIWNKEKHCLEEWQDPNRYLPIAFTRDLFQEGLCKIREEIGRGGKGTGFAISKERNR